MLGYCLLPVLATVARSFVASLVRELLCLVRNRTNPIRGGFRRLDGQRQQMATRSAATHSPLHRSAATLSTKLLPGRKNRAISLHPEKRLRKERTRPANTRLSCVFRISPGPLCGLNANDAACVVTNICRSADF